ncbi:hypothetical protein EW145_g1413 [Phellinidium pouzarii]|uniref:MINDY deubiquitinase domain-containing protein n=1 Tax=Phellinidium pouzarii TaxID=167371 RepID=A0A4S4LEK3_9AGAM|nr:hypothetical protein EW145_g1413 [Phellinidium pouzarii]
MDNEAQFNAPEPTTAPQTRTGPSAPPESQDDAAALSRAREENAQALQASREDVWPCSFIAICNILILRGDIEILPLERSSVSYDILSQLVGEYLLRTSPDVDLSAALTMMPLTQKGMDLNPLFTSPTAFRPAGDDGALKLFEQARIQLVHGWLVDPASAEYSVLSSTEDYDMSVNLIVEADTVAKGQFVVDENSPGPNTAGPSTTHISDQWSAEDRKKVEDALVVRNFLDSSSSQLTYHGLFTLASAIKPGSLVALFRNSHLSVLHRRADEDTTLFNLVTDYVFYNEPSVVWERLDDVDGGATTFVDATFRQSNPAGGDFAGHTAESALAALDSGAYAEFDPADHELARQLQAEEDARAQEMFARREQQRAGQRQQYDPRDPRYAEYAQQQQYQQQQQQPYDTRYAQQQQYSDPRGHQQYAPPLGPPGPPAKMKKKQSCMIM